MQNKTDNNNNEPQKNAVQTLAETFGSLDEMNELFDDILGRMMWAYTGCAQSTRDLVGDYDFIYALRKALKADLKNVALNFASEPKYPALERPTINPPKVSSATQAVQLAEARGIKDFRVSQINGEYVLLTNWTQAEVTAYQQNSPHTLWGSFSDEGVFMIRFLHLLNPQDNEADSKQ